MLDHLETLESQSIYIIREAYNRLEWLGMLWSLGKDSNVMLWLARKAFYGHVPFPVVHVDTEKKFAEMYEFRDHYCKEWNLNLVTGLCPPIEETDPTLPPAARAAARKTEGLKSLLAREGYTGLFAGIRRDEESTRAKERVFSPRGETGQWHFHDQPPEFWDQFKTDFPPGTHVRVHPLLHWSEIDVWLYTQRENIPTVPLYFARDGKRYRSLGDEDITNHINSEAVTIDEIIAELQVTTEAERAGRPMDHLSVESYERMLSEAYK